MSREELRVAVVGYGLAGRWFHAPLVAATPGMGVAAIVTSDPGRAEAARGEHPGARVVASADELWAAPGELDLVVVAAPNRAHVPLARAAIGAGLAVVVDKPLAPTAAEGRALADEARAAGVVLSVFHNRRWDGDFLTLRRLLDEGALGAPARLESRFERWRPEVDAERWRELPDPADAGGLLADLGSHLIDQAMVLFGRPVAVHAELDLRRPGARVEDDCFVALTHANGVRSHLSASMLGADDPPRMRAVGLAGVYVKRGVDVQEAALRAGGRPGGPGWGAEPEEAWGRLHDGSGARAVPTAPGDYPAFYAGMARALREGAPPPVDPDEAVAVLEVIEEARSGASRPS
ncbi:MAG TPA: Gfo/Idh/MocA family oxidoreductase [Miltoncostaeaceae bacterium]|nr:Gfo/Idh/MocA family oxidoreductase [Miltoncostaeaceae bacterium]